MPGFGLGFGAEELGGEERREGKKKRSEQRHLRAGGRRRRRRAVDSPDSEIFRSSDHHCAGNGNASVRSAGSHFSSTSGSAAYRCSFGSDQDPAVSQLSILVIFSPAICVCVCLFSFSPFSFQFWIESVDDAC